MSNQRSQEEWYWRCEGCGNFLDECELVNGDGHELSVGGGYVRLCGPVNKEKKKEVTR